MFSQCMQLYLLLHLAKCLLEVVLLVEIFECLTARVMLWRILDSSAEAVVASGMVSRINLSCLMCCFAMLMWQFRFD